MDTLLLKHISKIHKTKGTPASLTITARSGQQYDNMYDKVKQNAPDGMYAAVFGVSFTTLPLLVDWMYSEKPSDVPEDTEEDSESEYVVPVFEDLKKTVEAARAAMPLKPPKFPHAGVKRKRASSKKYLREIRSILDKIDRKSVTINIECCSDCKHAGRNTFTCDMMPTFKKIIDNGATLYLADFSLQTAEATWSEKLMGGNPFKHVGNFGGRFTLKFNSSKLEECNIPQLQAAGSLCDGSVQINALSSTYAFTLDKEVISEQEKLGVYEVTVLTIAQNQSGVTVTDSDRLECGEEHGLGGHIVIKYLGEGQGRIIASGCHWKEISNIDTTAEKIISTARKSGYSEVQITQIKREIDSCKTHAQRTCYIKKTGSDLIQSSGSAPLTQSSTPIEPDLMSTVAESIKNGYDPELASMSYCLMTNGTIEK